MQPKTRTIPQCSHESRCWVSAETLRDTEREGDLGLIGGDEGIRTLDLLSASQALFRAELRPHPREGYCTIADRRMLTSSSCWREVVYGLWFVVCSGKQRCKPSSVSLCRAVIIRLGIGSPQSSSGSPAPLPPNERWMNRARLQRSLFGLAPRGVYRALDVTIEAVGSYPTFSPLPEKSQAVYFLWHFPWGHPPFPLGSTLPCGARTFLLPGQARKAITLSTCRT